jgi:hypothetical protein
MSASRYWIWGTVPACVLLAHALPHRRVLTYVPISNPIMNVVRQAVNLCAERPICEQSADAWWNHASWRKGERLAISLDSSASPHIVRPGHRFPLVDLPSAADCRIWCPWRRDGRLAPEVLVIRVRVECVSSTWFRVHWPAFMRRWSPCGIHSQWAIHSAHPSPSGPPSGEGRSGCRASTE